MSYGFDETSVKVKPITFIKVMYYGIVVICALVSYCCFRRRRDTGTVLSRPVENSSSSNACLIPPIPLPPPPPPRTNHYQTPHIPAPQPASNAAAASDASDLPPSYDQFYAYKQPPYNHTAH